VDRDEGAVRVRLVDRRRHHRVGHVGGLRRVPRDDPVAGHHQLDRPDAELALLPDDPAHLLGAVDLCERRGADGPPLRDHVARGPQSRPLDQAAVDGPLDDDVDAGLQGARADQQRVAPAQVGAHDRRHLEGVLVVGHRRDLGVVEDEVQRPADVRVRIAQPGKQGGATDVDRAD
jgi:hypothetical protein